VTLAALSGFNSSAKTVDALLKRESRFADPPKGKSQDIVEGLRGGIAVLTIAVFENYLRDAFSEFANSINGHIPPVAFNRLPRKLQETSIIKGMNHVLRSPQYRLSPPSVPRFAHAKGVAMRVARDEILDEGIADTGGNPSSECVRTMFKCVGVVNVFTDLKSDFDVRWGPTSTTYLTDKLDEVVRRRHKVAHTGLALGIPRTDLAEGAKFVGVLAELLDKRLERHLISVIAGAT
jgi:hypothetical protein